MRPCVMRAGRCRRLTSYAVPPDGRVRAVFRAPATSRRSSAASSASGEIPRHFAGSPSQTNNPEQSPDIAPGFSCTSECQCHMLHFTLYACELHSLVTLPILRIAPVCYTPIGVICENSVRSSLSSFYLLPSVNTCFDIIPFSVVFRFFG